MEEWMKRRNKLFTLCIAPPEKYAKNIRKVGDEAIKKAAGILRKVHEDPRESASLAKEANNFLEICEKNGSNVKQELQHPDYHLDYYALWLYKVMESLKEHGKYGKMAAEALLHEREQDPDNPLPPDFYDKFVYHMNHYAAGLESIAEGDQYAKGYGFNNMVRARDFINRVRAAPLWRILRPGEPVSNYWVPLVRKVTALFHDLGEKHAEDVLNGALQLRGEKPFEERHLNDLLACIEQNRWPPAASKRDIGNYKIKILSDFEEALRTPKKKEKTTRVTRSLVGREIVNGGESEGKQEPEDAGEEHPKEGEFTPEEEREIVLDFQSMADTGMIKRVYGRAAKREKLKIFEIRRRKFRRKRR